jgi:hypothetical protein
MIEDENLTVAQQQHLKQVRQKVEELEKLMNYKAQPCWRRLNLDSECRFFLDRGLAANI